jgi:hypothetical protein
MAKLPYKKKFHNNSETRQEYTHKWGSEVRAKEKETRRKNRAKRKSKGKSN